MLAVVNKVYCNKCGKLLGGIEAECVEHIDHVIGYGSKYDGEKLAIDLCQTCFDEFVDDMKERYEISPIVEREW